MRKLIGTVVLLSVFFTFSVSLAKHGRGENCRNESKNMIPVDALVWTMANPNECGMDFLGYAREVKFIAEKMSDDTLKIPIINKLLTKHVRDLEKYLSEGRGRFSYFGALDYQDVYAHILFFKGKGFESNLDELALLKHLHNKIADVCVEEGKIMKRLPRKDREIYRSDIAEMKKRIGEK